MVINMLCNRQCVGCMMKCDDKEANDGAILEAVNPKRGRLVDEYNFEHEVI